MKVWNYGRKKSEIIEFMNKRFDPLTDFFPNGTLLAYTPLMENNFKFVNLASMNNPSIPKFVQHYMVNYVKGDTPVMSSEHSGEVVS